MDVDEEANHIPSNNEPSDLHIDSTSTSTTMIMPDVPSMPPRRRISDSHQQSRRKNDDHHKKGDDWNLPHNACAQSDWKAAVQAIQDTVQQELAGLLQSNKDDDDDDDGDTSTQVTSTTMLFQNIQETLVELLQKGLIPVADEDFQDFVDLYHVVPVHLEDLETDAEDEGTEEEIKVEDEEEEEIDQDDLLDRQALQEAQHLRSAVRDLAKHVEETREQVLQDSLLTIATGQRYGDLMKKVQERPLLEAEGETVAMQEQREALRVSLGALSSLLKDSQWSELPQQLESLQSTIDVIQKDSDKDRPISQIEAAIISRSNSAEEQDITTDWDDLSSQPSVGLTAADRLARFFELME